MATKAKRHTHKYQQIKMGSVIVWACGLKDCNHYMPKHLANMVPGKASLCWLCEKELILDERAMEFGQPVCKRCDDAGGIIPIEEQATEAQTQTQPTEQIEQLIESHIQGVNICTKCKRVPASTTFNNGLCPRCHLENITGVRLKDSK